MTDTSAMVKGTAGQVWVRDNQDADQFLQEIISILDDAVEIIEETVSNEDDNLLDPVYQELLNEKVEQFGEMAELAQRVREFINQR